MNKREFYKELMSEYMFDKDKICANAKKGRFAGRKSLPIYIGMTAAVAAVVVVAGTVVFTSLDDRGAVLISGDPLASLTEKQRIERAITDILNNPDSMEEADWLVTFTHAISPAMAKGVLTQYSGGSIPVTSLYMADETRISNTNEIGTVFKNNSGDVTGAIVHCSGHIRTKLQANEYVFAVEHVTAKDLEDGNLAPLNTEVNDPPKVNLPVISDSANSTSLDNSTSGNINPNDPTSTGIGTTTHEPSGIDDPARNPSTSVPDNTSSSSGNSNTSSEPNNSSTSETSKPNTSDPNVSVPEIPSVDKNKLPAGVKLPMMASKPAYITDDIGAQRAYFLSENVFYVKTENAVKLYKYNGEKETLAAEQEIRDAEVMWVSANGLRLMVSGTENGARRKLYIVDAKNCTINDMQIGDMLGEEGIIAEAAYNENSDLFVLNVLDDNSKYIFTANLSGYHTINEQIVAYGSEYMSILAAKGSSVYYSELNIGGVSVIYKNGETENPMVLALNGLCVSAANPAFTHALIVGEKGTFIFDPDTESLLSVDSTKNITFGASAHSFTDGSGYFTVKSGAIVPEENISEIAKVDFTRSFSSKYAAVVSNGSVRIIPSVYTKQVMSDGITFKEPVESSSSEQREAVNCGIGVVNAIASESCKECGIDTAEKLTATIESCFSESAAKALIESCKIERSGEFKYSRGSLSQISVSDTVLVMETETAGKLYIKVGTFEGKTAYTVRNVTLVDENGLKLDAVI